MGINAFENENKVYISFSQRFGMLQKASDKEAIDRIISKWNAEGYKITNSTPFSAEMQKKMAEAMRANGLTPIRSIDGIFEGLINSKMKYLNEMGQQKEHDQISLTLSEGAEKYVINLLRTSEAAALLVISCVDNMRIGQRYEVSVYNKIDQTGYKRTHVMLKDDMGNLVRKDSSPLFDQYVKAIQAARDSGTQYALTQTKDRNSEIFKTIVYNSVNNGRAQFLTELVDSLRKPQQIEASTYAVADDSFDVSGYDEAPVIQEPQYQPEAPRQQAMPPVQQAMPVQQDVPPQRPTLMQQAPQAPMQRVQAMPPQQGTAGQQAMPPRQAAPAQPQRVVAQPPMPPRQQNYAPAPRSQGNPPMNSSIDFSSVPF